MEYLGTKLMSGFFPSRYHVEERVAFKRQPKWKQHRGRKRNAKDRRLEKSMAWLADSPEDEGEVLWQQYLHSIRDRYEK